MIALHNGAISKYINGSLSFQKYGGIIIANLDRESLTIFLDQFFHEDDQKLLLQRAIKDKDPDSDEILETQDIVDYYYTVLLNIQKKNTRSKAHKSQDLKSDINLSSPSLAGSLINSKPNEVLEKLNVVEKEFDVADQILSNKLPPKIRTDFQYRLVRNSTSQLSPQLVPINKNAFINHTLSVVLNSDSVEDQNRIMRSIQKSHILKKPVEIFPKSSELYIDDYKDEFFVPSAHKHFVTPVERQPVSFNLHFNISNKKYTLDFDNLILQEEKIENDIIQFSNAESDEWLYMVLRFNCKNYVDNQIGLNMQLGIKTKYVSDIDCFKEFYKLSHLMLDNSSHYSLINIKNNKKLFDQNVTNGQSYTPDEYANIKRTIDGLEKISKIQKLTGIRFSFNPDEFEQFIPTYEIAYACVTGKKKTFNEEIESDIIVPKKDLKNYIIGNCIDYENTTDYMFLFDQKITFDTRHILMKNAEVIDSYIDDNQLHHVILKTNHIEIT